MSRMSFGGSRGRGNTKMRLIIAAVIAVVSFISYQMNTKENPVTGEQQKVALTTEQEIQLGLQAAPEMIDRHGGMHPDRAAQQHIDQIGFRLLQALNKDLKARGKTNPYEFEFHLLADPRTVNAFALPGGQVFMTAALYSRLRTEGEVAGVIGHEIGHVLSRHSAQRMAKQELTQGLAGAAGVAGGDMQSHQMAQMIGSMVNMKYGREDELESDGWGVTLMGDAGYDPRALFGVMDVLEEASGGGRQPEFLSTHPKPANRKEYIQQVIEKHYPNGVPDGLRP